MKRIPPSLLRRMSERLADGDRDEMAIPSYLHPNPVMRWMAWRRVEVLARQIERRGRTVGASSMTEVMDFGCGSGVLFDAACRAVRRVYGVDPVLDAASVLVDEWGLDRVVLLTPDDARERIGPESLDLILAAEVLEHIDPLGPTLAFFRERLRPGGALLASMPTENTLYRLGRRLAGFRGDYHHHDARSIDGELRRSGFRRGRLTRIPAPGPLAIYWIAEYRLA